MSKTETKTKAAAKVKPAAKVKAEPKTLFYATTLAAALSGEFGPLIQRFYLSACSYHLAQKTVFPRPRNAIYALLKPDEVGPWLKAREQTSIPAGDKTGQRLFDEMMVQTAQKSAAAPVAPKPVEVKAPPPAAKVETPAPVAPPAVTPPAPVEKAPVSRGEARRQRRAAAEKTAVPAGQSLGEKIKAVLSGSNLQPALPGPGIK